MQSSTGELSYTLNSRMQALALQRLHPMLQDVVNHSNSLKMASFVLLTLDVLLVQTLLMLQMSYPLVFSQMVHQNSNIFSMIFQQMISIHFSNNFHLWTERLYYAAAVPGSFWERLLPSSSFHIIFSSNALHWITNVIIQDKTLGAYNKGQTFINEKNPKAFEACGEDFQTNLQKFFVHGATELVSGGILILIFAGRWTNLPTTKINDGSPHPSMDNFINVVEANWEDLISEGLITTELRDSINVPIYLASMEEVRMALDETNVFVIQKFEMQKQIMSEVQGSLCENSKLFYDIVSNSWKAMYGEVIKVHIGEELANTYFQHLNKNLAKSSSKDWFNFMCEFLVVLVRK
ncbi:unnamed protein product [Sphagnum troendelagicum]|uniref:Uncharacterized protein n=1 Tax=Sphagnum troendelagicum TaxID=128251 RepID=A0ABP0U959_9BRYO